MTGRAGARLLLAHAMTATAMAMPWPALLARVWSDTQSDGWLGLAGASRMLPYVLLSAVAGILADRYRRTTVLRWSAGLRGVLLVACAVALHADALGWAVGLAVLTVALGTPAYPAAVAALPQLTRGDSGRLLGLLVTVEVSAFVVGPAAGGLLLGVGDAAWSVAAGAAIGVLAVPLLAGLDSGRPRFASTVGEVGRLRAVLGSPGVPAVIAVVALVNFTESAASVGLLSLSHDRWGTGDRGFGIGTAALGFGSMAAPLVALLVRLRGSLLLTAGGLAAAGAAPGVLLAAGPLAVSGAAGTTVECVVTDVLQRAVPDRVRAFSLGLTDSVMVLAAALGALLAPQLTSAVGPVPTLLSLALLLGLTGVWLFALRVRRAHGISGDRSTEGPQGRGLPDGRQQAGGAREVERC
jgi:MFS family permease